MKRSIAARSDLVLVVGSANSSNTVRMVEVSEDAGTRAYLLPDAGHLDPQWLAGVGTVGLSAGASAPEVLVDEVIAAFAERFDLTVEIVETAQERVEFKVPRVLREPALG